MKKLLVAAMALAVGMTYAGVNVAYSAEGSGQAHQGQQHMTPESSPTLQETGKTSPQESKKKAKKTAKKTAKKKARKSTQPAQ